MPKSRSNLPLWRGLVLLALVAGLILRAGTPPAAVPASAPAEIFSAERAMVHVRRIAERPHPIGSADIVRVRTYLVEQLTNLGLDVEVQEATAVGTRYQEAGRVRNVVARLPGTTPAGPAVLLMSHYDGALAGPAAADAGSGTAVVLETLRALKAGPPLTHDVIALLTEGEEIGLLGAAAFVREHRWANDVEATLNFEARGTTGRAAMFETGPGNLDLVRVLRAAPDVSASSLTVTAYRRLPNDTDLSELALLEKPALNYAFIDGVERYHTSRDDAAHLNLGSVQQEGAQALVVARALGMGPLPRPVTGDAIFFDVPLLGLLYYPESLARPLAVAAVVLLLFALVRTARTGRGWQADVALGALAVVVSVALGAGVGIGSGTLMTRIHAVLGGAPSFSDVYGAAIAAFALAAAAACWALVRRWRRAEGVQMGALLVWGVLTVLVSWTLPGLSHLFVWPLLAAIAAVLLRGAVVSRTVSQGLMVLVAVTLIVPTLYQLVSVGLVGLGAPVIGVLVPLLAWLLAPEFEAIVGARRGASVLWLLAAGALFSAAGALTVRFSADRPERSSIAYAVSADQPEALMVTAVRSRGGRSWSEQALGVERQTRRITADTGSGGAPGWLAAVYGRGAMVATASAPSVPVEPPRVTVLQDSLWADGRKLTLQVQAAPGTLSVMMRAVSGTVVAAAVDGVPVETGRYRNRSSIWSLQYAAPPVSGYTLELTLPAGEPLTLDLVAQSAGLPAPAAAALPERPLDVAPAFDGDVTLVHTRVIFAGFTS